MTGTDAAVDAVRAALEHLAPAGVRTGALPVEERHVAHLHARERSTVVSAAAARRREFATGRALLRHLIGEPVEIPRSASRAPQLPDGLVGTLSHDADLAAAAVSSVEVAAALGLDLERTRPMGPSEVALVRRPDEADLDARLVFVLKEAAYKAWSGLGGELLDFPQVRVTVEAGAFEAEVLGRATTLRGRFAEAGGRWLALVVRAPGDASICRGGLARDREAEGGA